MQMPTRGRPVKAAERLTQINSWCIAPYPGLLDFMNNLIELRTDAPHELLEMTAGQIVSGSQVHRLDDHVTNRTASNNIRPNSSTHIYISTDNAGRFSRGSDNYNIHFQGAILYGIWVISIIWYYLYSTGRSLAPYKVCILKYGGHYCEEKILVVRLHNNAI